MLYYINVSNWWMYNYLLHKTFPVIMLSLPTASLNFNTVWKPIFTWDKHVYSRLIVLFRVVVRLTLGAFIRTHVVPGILHCRVVDEECGRVVPGVHEGVLRQGFGPNHVSFPGAADVEDGVGLQDELVVIGHDGWWRQSRGNWKMGLETLQYM